MSGIREWIFTIAVLPPTDVLTISCRTALWARSITLVALAGLSFYILDKFQPIDDGNIRFGDEGICLIVVVVPYCIKVFLYYDLWESLA